MNCKICGKSLYEQVTFFNLFNPKYKLHDRCKKNVNIHEEEVHIPFEDSFIIFKGIIRANEVFDSEYVFCRYVGLLFEQHLLNSDWSIILFLDSSIPYETLKLVFYLANKHLFIFSIFQSDIFYLEKLLAKKISV